jgi:SPP1 family predicted phage head-tail adaptor
MIRAGTLDRVIHVERSVETIDAAGVVSTAWTPIATLRAELITRATIEAGIAAGEAATADLTFRTRYLADLTTADRILFESQALNITGVDEIGRRKGLTIRAARPAR